MRRHFATLFDRNYLAKGIVLHESLVRHSSEPFTLHVLCMDTPTHVILSELQLPNVELIPLSTFERALHLENIKAGRSWTEFCWTCASNFLEYLLPWTDGATYIDADLMFFSDPKVIFDEIGDRSIGITPHRFAPEHKRKEVNGRFNVGLVYIRNSEAGRKCIEQWARNCRDWCYNRVEGERACGDQKYLDDFERDFPGEVCAIQNIGVNVAPWNVSQWLVTEGPRVDGAPVVFYHYHEFSWPAGGGPFQLTNYRLRNEDRVFLYDPYLIAYEAASLRIAEVERAREERQREMQFQSESA